MRRPGQRGTRRFPLAIASTATSAGAGVYWPGSVESFVAVLGLLIAVVGALLGVCGVLSLGRSFTPLPRPRARTRLRQGGIFRLVRHPVYGGAILIGLGWSLADAPLGLVPTALLAVLIDRKAQRAETWLIERFPDYALYRAHTPHRFVWNLSVVCCSRNSAGGCRRVTRASVRC